MKTAISSARYSKFIERLPITFRPFINEQITRMDRLFAFERNVIESFVTFVDKLSQSEFERLFKPVREVEKKMDVEQWKFSEQGETLENTSLLAHSPYYQEWRAAVQDVFDTVTKHAHSSANHTVGNSKHRLVLIVLPRSVPVKKETVWNEWPVEGRQLKLADGDSLNAPCSEILLGGSSLLGPAGSMSGHTAEDLWVLDAGFTLRSALPVHETAKRSGPSAIYLSYTELKTFREEFRDRLNWVRKDLADADKVIASLRQTDVTPWCPEALKNQVAPREFVKDLFLSGNGAVVFGNAFVQWAANEALRRARPRILVACFGTRNKPKPFTSIAILEDQEHTSPVPDTVDPEGSAVDVQILARYVLLAASRYEEYRDALCLCVADTLPAIYAIAPAEHPLFSEPEPVTVERVRQILDAWIS